MHERVKSRVVEAYFQNRLLRRNKAAVLQPLGIFALEVYPICLPADFFEGAITVPGFGKHDNGIAFFQIEGTGRLGIELTPPVDEVDDAELVQYASSFPCKSV